MMEKIMIGYDFDHIEANEFGVEIKKDKSLLCGIDASNITIPYDQISAVALVKPGFLTVGYIEIKFPGNNYTTGNDPNKNPYAYSISKSEYDTAVKMKKIIEEKIIEEKNKFKMQYQNINSINNATEDLINMKKLLDNGVITQEEFNKKKKELLNL